MHSPRHHVPPWNHGPISSPADSFPRPTGVAALIVVAFLCLSACASRQPSLDQGVYRHPVHGFAFAVPDGWQASLEMPAWLAPTFPGESAQNFDVLLEGPGERGFLVVGSDRHAMEFERFASPEGQALLLEAITREQRMALDDPATFSASAELLGMSGGVLKVATSRSVSADGQTMITTSREAFYACGQGHTCQVKVLLVCFRETLLADLDIMESIYGQISVSGGKRPSEE